MTQDPALSSRPARRRRGRPRGFDTDEAATEAMRLFWARGFEGISTAELGIALGLNPPSLYAAFGSKAGLFAAALDRYQARIAPAFSGMEVAPDVGSLVAAVLEGAADLYTRAPETPGCLVLDGARGTRDAAALDAVRHHRSAFRGAVRDRLVTLGDSAADDRADALVVAMMGLSASARAGLPRESIQSAARSFAAGIASQTR